MNNKKGFTLIEFIVSITLTMIILLFLLKIVIMLKDIYFVSGIKTEMLVKQSIISEELNKGFEKNVVAAYQYSGNLYWFFYADGTNSKLEIDQTNKILTYGTYSIELTDGSTFGTIDVKTETVNGVSANKNNSFLKVHIPINNSLVKGDFGITTIYQYDSRVTAIGSITSPVPDNSNSLFLLKGDMVMNLNVGDAFVEPGYYFINEFGNLQDENGSESAIYTVTTPTNTELACITSATTNTTCNLTYTLFRNDLSVSTKIRTINMTIATPEP